MKSLKVHAVLGLTAVLMSLPVFANDRSVYLPLEEAVAAAKAAGKIDDSVKFYLAGATTPKGQTLQRDIVVNKKTNAVFKKDINVCNYVGQSAVIALHNAAKKAGANAVTNIVSFYRQNEYKSSTDYECHAGATVAGTTLKGDLVKLK